MDLTAVPVPFFAAVLAALLLGLAGVCRRSNLLLVLAGMIVATAAGFAVTTIALA